MVVAALISAETGCHIWAHHSELVEARGIRNRHVGARAVMSVCECLCGSEAVVAVH